MNDIYEKNYKFWTVDADGTIDPEIHNYADLPEEWRPPAFEFFGVEVKTPAMKFSHESLTEIQHAIELITKNFNTYTNSSCGLHCHVGNQDKGFPLQTVKNFTTLVTIFERQFNSLHPANRIENQYCKPPGMNFAQKRWTTDYINHPIFFENGAHPWDVARIINDIPSIDSLVDRFSCSDEGVGLSADGYNAYNIGNLVWTDLKTIEFRQHEGTLSIPAIRAWVELTCSLVGMSHAVGYVGFVELIYDQISSGAVRADFSVIELLRILGLKTLADYYEGRGFYNHKKQPWDWDDLTDERLEELANRKALENVEIDNGEGIKTWNKWVGL